MADNNMNGAGELIVCEYSVIQRCFHVETLAEALQKNMIGLTSGRGADFIPFALADDWDEANQICEKMRKKIVLPFHH